MRLFTLFCNTYEFILVCKHVLNYPSLKKKDASERGSMFIEYPQHTATYPQRYTDSRSSDLTQLYSPVGKKESTLYML